MSTEPNDVEATMLLCDAAQSIGGKLYILGGGWSRLLKMEPTAEMALAVRMAVPWSRANEQLQITAVLKTDQGIEVKRGDDLVRTEGQIEVGRPPGVRPGTPLDATFVINFRGLDLVAGGYVWELKINDNVAARAPFTVTLPEAVQQ